MIVILQYLKPFVRVQKQSSDSFNNVIYKMSLQIIYVYLIYMYKQNFALNNLQWLRCRKTERKQNKIYTDKAQTRT